VETATEADPHWRQSAVCGQTDPDVFFPDTGRSKITKRTCAGCPVRTECLEWALTHGERFGIWGGLSEQERDMLKKERKS